MKKLLLLFSAVLAVSCSSDPKDIAKKNFEEKFKSSLNDPDSYEFVEMGEFKDVKAGPYFKWKNAELNQIKYGMTDTTEIANKRKELDVYKNDPEKTIGYVTIVKARANNALGAKVLNSYKVELDTVYKVTNISNYN